MSAIPWDIVLYAAGMFSFLLILMPYSPMTIDWLSLPRTVQIKVYLYRHLLWAIGIGCFAVSVLRAVAGITGLQVMAGIAELQAVVGVADPVWLKITGISALMLVVFFWTGYVPYVMTPPSRHQILSAAAADNRLKPSDIVLGFVHGGQARAYLRDQIARPHFFPDTVAGTPVTISYCILCNSAMAFKSDLNGKPLRLKTLTAYNNNIIYLDRKSGNFIQQLGAEVVYGPDKGKRLDELPDLVFTTWGEWKRLHPDTTVYYAPPTTMRDKLVAAMLQWMVPVHKLARRSKPFHRVKGRLDDRLPAMSFVYGLELNDESCAYPESYLEQSRVINDTVGGEPVVVLFDPKAQVGNVYSRRIGGKTLNLSPAAGPPRGTVARDSESGSLWNIDGVAVEGRFGGQSLRPIPHFNKLFWFSWALFNPRTGLKTAAAGGQQEAAGLRRESKQ